MPYLRTTLLLPMLGLTLGLAAQENLRITDIRTLAGSADLASDKAALAGLQAAGLEEQRVSEALAMGKKDHWPEGIRSDSARTVNRISAQNYQAHRFCTFADTLGSHVVVWVPAKENYHMPEDLRPKQDLYLVLPENAVERGITDAQRPKPSKGPGWRTLPTAKILQPDAVYATYDLSRDPEALEALTKHGMSQPEIDAVVFRSQERNWPEGIDSFHERYPRLKDFKKYKAFEAARWNGKVLIVIPAELNRKAPPLLRPYLDIYMVYQQEAVATVEKRK